MTNYYLYILKSTRDSNYYVGITADIRKRLDNHNSGKVRSTQSRKPFILIYTEQYDSMAEVRLREKYLKSYSGVGEKRNIIEKYNNIGV
jgi:putative endonuclease